MLAFSSTPRPDPSAECSQAKARDHRSVHPMSNMSGSRGLPPAEQHSMGRLSPHQNLSPTDVLRRRCHKLLRNEVVRAIAQKNRDMDSLAVRVSLTWRQWRLGLRSLLSWKGEQGCCFRSRTSLIRRIARASRASSARDGNKRRRSFRQIWSREPRDLAAVIAAELSCVETTLRRHVHGLKPSIVQRTSNVRCCARASTRCGLLG